MNPRIRTPVTLRVFNLAFPIKLFLEVAAEQSEVTQFTNIVIAEKKATAKYNSAFIPHSLCSHSNYN